MRGARIICTAIAALLLVTGALLWAGCGEKASSAQGGDVLSGLQPFVASAMVAKDEGGTSTVVGDVTQLRDYKVTYTVEASDARASGTFEVIINMDTAADGSSTMWGTWVVTNSKGTWVCDRWTGAQEADGHSFTFGESSGTGEYEGLLSYWQWHWPLNVSSFSSSSRPIAVSGWIEKAK